MEIFANVDRFPVLPVAPAVFKTDAHFFDRGPVGSGRRG